MKFWEEYKRRVGTTRPWHVMKGDKVTDQTFKQRYDTCLSCPRFLHVTAQCLECGCIMPLKARLKDATCPLGKW